MARMSKGELQKQLLYREEFFFFLDETSPKRLPPDFRKVFIKTRTALNEGRRIMREMVDLEGIEREGD